MRWTQRIWILAAMALALLAPASAQAPKRVALVIANAAYTSANVLTNPLNDGAIVAAALRRAGFQTVNAKNDLGVAAFQRALRDFRAQADGAQIALIYYAGHGIEGNGRNWLIPTDAALNTERDLDYEAINLDLVMSTVQGADLRVVILDACRNNPLGRNWRRGSRAVSRGLGGVDADDVLVIYAAAPGETASDGTGVNSPFATALAARLPQADLPIQLLGGAVRDDVLRATGGVQRPFVSASITGTPFYLMPRAVGAVDPELERLRREVETLRRPGAGTAASPAVSAPAMVAPRPNVGEVARAPGSVFRDCSDCPEMVMIAAGSFVMGKPSGEAAYQGYNGAEEPQRTVRVRRFAAGRYEITRGEWSAFVNATGRVAQAVNTSARSFCVWSNPGFAQDDRHPVACVNWQDAQAYAAWLSQKTGQTYRLLTETEWEYAARANTTTIYWFGVSASPRHANYADSGNNGTVRVGAYAANAFGLYDVSGNLWEWVQDCWHENYNGALSDGSAWTTDMCADRVVRGGAWYYPAAGLRSAGRVRVAPADRGTGIGFRLARTVSAP